MKLFKTSTYTLALVASFLVPALVLAQENVTLTFVNSASLWIAIVVGFIAAGMVFRNAQKIGGGSLQKVYNFFASGMFLVVLGFFSVVVPSWAPTFVIMRTHDILFIIGFAAMAYGASKMLSDAGL